MHISTTRPIGVTEVARLLGKSRRQAHRLIASGDLSPVAKLPGRTGAYLFDPADVEALRDQAERLDRGKS